MLVIVASYNMEEFLTNTLFSLSRYYQNLNNYEVLVFSNGGKKINKNFFYKFGKNFKYKHIVDAEPHPFYEINNFIKNTNYENIVIVCDGGRICSYNILEDYNKLLNEDKNNVCICPGYHLGFDLQRKSVKFGYDREFEEKILFNSRWWLEKSSIFDISVFGGSTNKNLYSVMPLETNCLGINKDLFLEIGGFTKGFKIPGGGQINLDLFQKICKNESISINYFINHGTFHQLHGGASTNSKDFASQKRNEDSELKNLGIKINNNFVKKRDFIIKLNGPKRNIVEINKINISHQLISDVNSKSFFLIILSFLKSTNKEKIKDNFIVLRDYILIKKMHLRLFLEKNKMSFIVKIYRNIFK